jgi:hypothetical protein
LACRDGGINYTMATRAGSAEGFGNIPVRGGQIVHRTAISNSPVMDQLSFVIAAVGIA